MTRTRAASLIWCSIVLFAVSSSIVRLLQDLGAAHLVDGRNPISFCNLLFAGNACAVLGLSVYYRKQLGLDCWRALSLGDWVTLTLLAMFTTALAPSLFFIALDNTSVTSVVLVAQIEPPLVLVLSAVFLGERVSRGATAGAALCLCGVAIAVVFDPAATGLTIGKGELLTAAAALIYAVSTVVARPRLKRVPVGLFAVFRTALGTVVFFIVVLVLFGAGHFMDVTSPFLWKWMLVYGGVIIVLGQIAWFSGLGGARTTDIALASSATPILGALAAFVILAERPTGAQLVGGGVLVAGIAVAYLSGRSVDREPAERAEAALAAETGTGFKGV